MPDKIKKKVETKTKGPKPTQGFAVRVKTPEKNKSKEKSLTNEKVKEKAALAAISRMSGSQLNVLDWSLADKNENVTGGRSNHGLAVDGVYFRCPMISSEILSKSLWKQRIRDYLKEQLAIEKGRTSCLMIHTLTADKERVNQCVETLCTYLSNILNNPHEEKFKKIRLTNKIFQNKVYPIEGAVEFLLASGFRRKSFMVDGCIEEYLLFDDNQYDKDHLEILIEAVKSTEPIHLEVDRNLAVLSPEQAAVRVELPDDFYTFTAEDLKREQRQRQHQQEDSLQLRTKAMRMREEQKALKKYKYTLIRIRFPDNKFLQGTFGVFEKFKAVREFVKENLSVNGKFTLVNSLGKTLSEVSDNISLYELKLVPAVLLTFVWGKQHPPQFYLKPQLLKNVLPLS